MTFFSTRFLFVFCIKLNQSVLWTEVSCCTKCTTTTASDQGKRLNETNALCSNVWGCIQPEAGKRAQKSAKCLTFAASFSITLCPSEASVTQKLLISQKCHHITCNACVGYCNLEPNDDQYSQICSPILYIYKLGTRMAWQERHVQCLILWPVNVHWG